MKRLTNEELAQIRERVEKATRGEWTFVPIVDSLEYFIAGENGQEAVASEIFMLNDADFIAHAREDIPKLLAEIGRMRELLSKAYQYGISSEAYQKDGDIQEIYEYLYGGDDE